MKHAPIFFALALVSAEFFKAAMTVTKMKLKEVAYLMRIDEAQLRRQLEGDGHLSVKRMESLPLSFHQEYHFAGLSKCGLPKRLRRLALIQLALMGESRRNRMLKAEWATDKKEEIA